MKRAFCALLAAGGLAVGWAQAGWRCDGAARGGSGLEGEDVPGYELDTRALGELASYSNGVSDAVGLARSATQPGHEHGLEAVTNAGDLAGLDNIPAGLVTNLNDSFWAPTFLTSGPTVTITRAHGALCALTVTNAVCVIRMATSGWSTGGVGRVSLDLRTGNRTVTWDTNTIHWGQAFEGNTNGTVAVQLRRHWQGSRWEARQ